MVSIHISEDCENAPKKAFVKAFNIAFVGGDKTEVLNSLSDSIQWNLVGRKPLIGKQDVSAALDTMMGDDIEALRLHNIISHGDRCAANGTLKLTDGTTIAFCDMYAFDGSSKDARIKEITSYIIEFKKK